jgi:hypothetical protein
MALINYKIRIHVTGEQFFLEGIWRTCKKMVPRANEGL